MKNIPLSSAITACPLSNICGSVVKGRNAIGVVNKREIKSAMRNCTARPCFQSLGLGAAAWRKANKLHCSGSFLKLICTNLYTGFKGNRINPSFRNFTEVFCNYQVGSWSNIYKTSKKKKGKYNVLYTIIWVLNSNCYLEWIHMQVLALILLWCFCRHKDFFNKIRFLEPVPGHKWVFSLLNISQIYFCYFPRDSFSGLYTLKSPVTLNRDLSSATADRTFEIIPAMCLIVRVKLLQDLKWRCS